MKKAVAVRTIDSKTGDVILGGGLEGASRTKRETALWSAPMNSPDRAINPGKREADARGRQMAVDDGYTQGAIRTQKDSIVGASYRLNAKPDYRTIFGADSKAAQSWAEEFASVAESRFNLAAESEDCWFDAGGMLTFTGMLRLWIGAYVYTGEIIGTGEWLDSDPTRPFKTAIQMLPSDRLCNKDGEMDSKFLSNGVAKDRRGKPVAFHFRRGHPGDFDLDANAWDVIPARLPWGRRQVIFVRDPMQIDQTRGVSEMVAALAHSKMVKTHSELVLQKAVVDASYAATIESELPNSEVIASMGGGQDGWMNAIGNYMEMLNSFLGASENITIDGVKMPHLFPGTKLNMQPMGTPGGIGDDFEASLIRKLAATFGVGYSEMSRDFAKFNYSGLKAEIALIDRTMQAKKKFTADRVATQIYQLWLEEEMAQGNLPLPPGRNRTDFYRPLMKDAYTRCNWISTGRGQIDELKETQAAMLRIKAGLSTYEDEAAKLGRDWRDTFAQRAKEEAAAKKFNLPFSLDAQKAGNNEARDTMKGGKAGAKNNQTNNEEDDDDD